jgi:hypothetical protein
MMHRKTGRLPPRHTQRTMRSALVLHDLFNSLGTPPGESKDYVSAVMRSTGWINWYNSQLGDCVCEDSGHELMLVTANAGQIIIPAAADILDLYEKVGGYVPGNSSTDQGCDETTMCEYMVHTGLCGQKAAGTGMVNPANLDHVRWAVQLFGACRLGIIVDSNMEQQFESGQPWTTPANPDDPDSGGHDVPVVRYDANYAYVVTWGSLQPVAWSLMAQSTFVEEAHATVWPAFIQSNGSAPNGLNLMQLLADLPEVA